MRHGAKHIPSTVNYSNRGVYRQNQDLCHSGAHKGQCISGRTQSLKSAIIWVPILSTIALNTTALNTTILWFNALVFQSMCLVHKLYMYLEICYSGATRFLGVRVNWRGYGSNFPDSPPLIANVHALVHIVRLLLLTFFKEKLFLSLMYFFFTQFPSLFLPPTCTTRGGSTVG